MRFPSVAAMVRDAGATLSRFPLPILSGLAATAVSMRMIEGPSADWAPRLLATAALGLPLFTASVTTAERHGLAPGRRAPVDIALVLGLTLLFLASRGWTDRLASLRFAQLLVAGHLLVAVAPYLRDRRLEGFWQYNRFLFLRYLLASFYSLVLWLGLAIALAALNKLLGMKVPGETYGHLWSVLAFGFHPWFFLAGLPRDYRALDQLEDYPIGLKVFTQFVLMPLVAIYLTILTAYLGKVIVTRTWPSGWIGYLVSSVSTAGVLALLLVHPIRERADSRWVDAYGRWWFVAILPSLAMLLLATGKRVSQYGITEPRYFLLALALWLSGLALYYGVTASRNIKLIPVSLCVIALFTALGPWGAYAVSRRSQETRFARILPANRLGPGGAVAAPGSVSLRDRRELSAILRYLRSTHGPAAVARMVGVPTDTVLAWKKSSADQGDDAIASPAMKHLGLIYVSRWGEPGENTGFWSVSSAGRAWEVKGFELAQSYSLQGLAWMVIGTDSLQLVGTDGKGSVLVKHAGITIITLDVPAAVRDAVPAESLSLGRPAWLSHPIVVEGEGAGFRVRLVLESASGRVTPQGLVVNGGNGQLLAAGTTERR